MEALVTGAGGLLGSHLVPELVKRGHSVRILALPGEVVSRFDHLGVTVHRGDIRDRETLSGPLRGADAVIHLAGMMGVWQPLADYRAVNVAGTANVCRAALAEGVGRVVHVSSWTVYGMNRGHACREDLPFRPFPEPYALTKAEGDGLVRRLIAEEGLPAVVIRPGTFFGPGDSLHFGRIADRLRAGKGIIVGRGDNALPFVYVTDVVQGLLLGLEHDGAVGQAFNITTDEPLTQVQFLRATAEETAVPTPRRHVPYRLLYSAGAAAERLAAVAGSKRQPPLTRLGVNVFGTENRHSIEKARTELGYRPQVSLRDGIRRASEWYLSNVAAKEGQRDRAPVSAMRRPAEADLPA